MVDSMKLKANTSTFIIEGVVFGMNSAKTYVEKEGSGFRMLNLGIRVSSNENLYLSLSGSPKNDVFWSKRDKDGKTDTIRLKQGEKSPGKDYRPIGVAVKLEKNGEIKYFSSYDACLYLKENLTDGMSVFVKGKVEFSSWTDKDGNIKRGQKLVPNSIYIKDTPIDFNDEKYVKRADVTQGVVFLGVERPQEGSEYATIKCGVVGYNSWEEIELPSLVNVAKTLNNRIKPYTSISLNCGFEIESGEEEVEVEEVDGDWGQSSKVNVQRKPVTVKLLVLGAEPKSIDSETYNKKTIEEWVQYIENVKKSKEAESSKNFESQDGDWGKPSSTKEEEPAW